MEEPAPIQSAPSRDGRVVELEQRIAQLEQQIASLRVQHKSSLEEILRTLGDLSTRVRSNLGR